MMTVSTLLVSGRHPAIDKRDLIRSVIQYVRTVLYTSARNPSAGGYAKYPFHSFINKHCNPSLSILYTWNLR